MSRSLQIGRCKKELDWKGQKLAILDDATCDSLSYYRSVYVWAGEIVAGTIPRAVRLCKCSQQIPIKKILRIAPLVLLDFYFRGGSSKVYK